MHSTRTTSHAERLEPPPRGSSALERTQYLLEGVEHQLSILRNKETEDSFAESLILIQKYELLTQEIYRERSRKSRSPYARLMIEDAFSKLTLNLVHLQSRESTKKRYSWFVGEYRSIWRRELSLFLFCLVVFFATCLIGWNTTIDQPLYASVMVPQVQLELVLDHTPWFERLQDNPLLGGLQIGFNNIMVSIRAFIGGLLLGVGGLIILAYNGIILGSIFGFCFVHDFHGELGNFVLTHGPLELSIIVAAAFTSLVYGQVFFSFSYRTFAQRFRDKGRDALILVIGILPWLVLAAFFEGFVSPFHFLNFQQKLILGNVLGLTFWIWTFWPNQALIEERNKS